MPGYTNSDLDEVHAHPSPFTFSQSLAAGSSGMALFSLPTDPSSDLLSASAWTTGVEGTQNLQDFPDTGSCHSGDAEEYIFTSGQTTPRGSRMSRSQAMGSAWNNSRTLRAQAMSRASSNKSHTSTQMSTLDLRGNSDFRNMRQAMSATVDMDSCLLVDSDPCTTMFWDNGFSMNLEPVDHNTPFAISSMNDLHVAPTEMQFGPDASLRGSSSPSSLDCFSSPDSSQDAFDDQTWVSGPRSPSNSSPELQGQSPSSVERMVLKHLDITSAEDSSNVSVTYGSRRSSGEGESARDHTLYKNAIPQSDGLYHCPWEGQQNCNHRPEKLKCNYDKFVDSHLKPYRCKAETCEGNRFSSTACLLRHEREAHGLHGHGDKPFLCMYKGCERSLPGGGFPRQWNLRDHMKRVHNDFGTTGGSPPSSMPGRQQPAKGRKRKTEVPAAAQPTVTARKAAIKSLPEAEAKKVSSQPLLEEWMNHRHAVENMIRGLNKPEDSKNIQQIIEVQKRLEAMVKMTADLSASNHAVTG